MKKSTPIKGTSAAASAATAPITGKTIDQFFSFCHSITKMPMISTPKGKTKHKNVDNDACFSIYRYSSGLLEKYTYISPKLKRGIIHRFLIKLYAVKAMRIKSVAPV